MARTIRLWSAGFLVLWALTGCGSSRTLAKLPSSLRASTRVTSPPPLSLNDLAMVTSQNGWGLAPGRVVVTHNGGHTWRNVTPSGFPVNSAHLLGVGSIAAAFPTARRGIIAQERTSTIRVWRTIDAGAHWTMATWRAPESIRLRYFFEGSLLMQFANADDGLLILSAPGNPGSSSDAVLATTDGGLHWHLHHNTKKISATYLSPSPTTAFGDISGLSLSPSGWGLASINTMIWGRAWVLTTDSGGRSWASDTLPLPPVVTYDSVNEGAQAVQGTQGGWLWLSLYNNHTDKQQWLVEHTTDGGAQWIQIPWTQSTPQPSTLGGVDLWPLGRRVLLLVAESDGTEIWRWESHHAKWQKVSHLPLETITSVSLLPNGDGWVIGDTGSYHTTNGGVTWKVFAPQLH